MLVNVEVLHQGRKSVVLREKDQQVCIKIGFASSISQEWYCEHIVLLYNILIRVIRQTHVFLDAAKDNTVSYLIFSLYTL